MGGINKIIRRFFKWIFNQELQELNFQIKKTKETNAVFKNVLQNIDVSVDVHEPHRYSRSWAVISLQGNRSDYLKFVDLGDSEIREIQRFLRNFERSKIDASPQTSAYLRVRRR